MLPEAERALPIDHRDPFAERVRPRDLPELMDDCTDPQVLRGCLHDLAFANLVTGSYRPTLRFLKRAIDRHPPEQRPLRIVDVGCGYGDMLRRIAHWAARRRVAVELIGVDLHPLATQIAAEATAVAKLTTDSITWRTGDVMTMTDLAPDIVLTSLVMHHLEDAAIVRMLRWMESAASVGWFINDLERQRAPVRLWSLLAHLLRWHAFLHHDGPVSFRRAFRHEDWTRLLQTTGIPLVAATIEPTFPARLCVARLR